jgi:NACalpha-BTF3-like transcription factor
MPLKRLQDMTEPQLQHLMKDLATSLLDTSSIHGIERPLFVLLLFNDPRVSQYVSNAQRADVIKALREAADRLERREDVQR